MHLTEGNRGESNTHSYRRKDLTFYRQIHARACTDTRERKREREGGEIDVLTKHVTVCVMHYDYSVWPAGKDEG